MFLNMGKFHIAGILFVFLLFTEYTQLCVCGNSSIGCIEGERQTLFKFKRSLEDPSNKLSSWEGTECCKWEGIVCHRSTGHVQKLDLRSINLDDMIKGRKIDSCLLELRNLNYLDLSGNQFYGSPIPEFLGLMKRLRYLNLSTAHFAGVVPSQLGNLTNLQVLDISDGKPALTIPNFVRDISDDTPALTIHNLEWLSRLSSLQHLDMSHVDLNGAHDLLQVLNMLPFLMVLRLSNCGLDNNHLSPAQLNFTPFPSINHLDLSRNSFKGPFPIVIQNMTSLRVLHLSESQLHGSIPAALEKLSSLRVLDLSHNQLTGVIPDSIRQLSQLKRLDISSNSLEGSISEIHLSNLSKLEEFVITSNHLTVKVKPSWIPPFQLKYIGMGSCNIGTEFPRWLETQKNVTKLDLSNSSISGPLPEWIQSMHNLSTLLLSHNQITGPLPRNIGDLLPTLTSLQLDDNLINDTIPSSFCTIKGLLDLDISENMLTGDIPNCWSYLHPLCILKLSSNKLTGVIPNSIGNLSGLQWLHLNNNSLKGELPSLRNCTTLYVLNLGENEFSGNIPTWIGENLLSLQILRLPNNMFDGYIPLNLCHLSSLQILDLAANNLAGTIPHCLGNISGMVFGQSNVIEFNIEWISQIVVVVMKGKDIEYTRIVRLVVNLDLSGNNLVGTIPEELTMLSGLLGLNLSHNCLTGNIPKSIGKMKSLESLDFSRNQLSANIPTSMSDLTSLSHLDLSYNNFTGKIPTGQQLQTLVDPSIYAGNPGLCGAPLVKICPGDELHQVPSQNNHEENDDKEDESEKVIFYFAIVLGYLTGLWGVIGVLLWKKNWRDAYFRITDVAVAVTAAGLKKKMGRTPLQSETTVCF